MPIGDYIFQNNLETTLDKANKIYKISVVAYTIFWWIKTLERVLTSIQLRNNINVLVLVKDTFINYLAELADPIYQIRNKINEVIFYRYLWIQFSNDAESKILIVSTYLYNRYCV